MSINVEDIKRITLNPDDVLVVTVKDKEDLLTQETTEKIKATFLKVLPPGSRVLVLGLYEGLEVKMAAIDQMNTVDL